MKVVQRDTSEGPWEAEGQGRHSHFPPWGPAFLASIPCFSRAGACDERPSVSPGWELRPRDCQGAENSDVVGRLGPSFPPLTEAAAVSMEDLDLATRDWFRMLCGLGLVFSFFTAEKARRVAADRG